MGISTSDFLAMQARLNAARKKPLPEQPTEMPMALAMVSEKLGHKVHVVRSIKEFLEVVETKCQSD